MLFAIFWLLGELIHLMILAIIAAAVLSILLGFGVVNARSRFIYSLMDFLNRVTTRRAVVFLLSDFHAANYEKPLTICSRRHDLIAIPIEDRGELALPKIGLVQVEDPETGAIYEINSSDRRVQSQFREVAEKERIGREALLRRKNIDSVPLRTDQDFFPVLRSFFIRRETRLRRR